MPKINWWVNRVFDHGYDYIKIRKLDRRTFEIPNFSNVMLEYKMTGDFKKFIHKIDVVERNFFYRHVPLFGRKKTLRQDDSWRAIFTFTRIPKSGYLEVKFL